MHNVQIPTVGQRMAGDSSQVLEPSTRHVSQELSRLNRTKCGELISHLSMSVLDFSSLCCSISERRRLKGDGVQIQSQTSQFFTLPL